MYYAWANCSLTCRKRIFVTDRTHLELKLPSSQNDIYWVDLPGSLCNCFGVLSFKSYFNRYSLNLNFNRLYISKVFEK